jgi:hypothetical protein
MPFWLAHLFSSFCSASGFDSSRLADYGRAYEKIEQMNSFPADNGALYILAAAVVVPALPMILAQVPFVVVLSDLFRALH